MAEQVIGILGSFSGNNAGDSALLDATMSTILAELPEARFIVPTSQPGFVRKAFASFPVTAFPIRVRYGSAKFWGLPAMWPFLRCDALVTTGSLLFDRQLLNPFFNVLLPWSVQIPLAQRLGKPVIGFNIGIGPLRTPLGERLSRRILDHMDSIVLRQPECMALLERWGMATKAESGADTALVLAQAGELETLEQLQAMHLNGPEALIGVNLCHVIHDMAEEGTASTRPLPEFIRELAGALVAAISIVPAKLLGVVTNELDRQAMEQLAAELAPQALLTLTPKGMHHRLLAGLAGRCQLMIGMRLHALVFAAAAAVPTIGLSYSPKVRSFMQTLGWHDWIVDLSRVERSSLADLILKSWNLRHDLRALLTVRLVAQKRAARNAAQVLAELLHDRGRR